MTILVFPEVEWLVEQNYLRYKYMLNHYSEYQNVLFCHNTASFSEDSSPDSTRLNTREV